MRRAFVTKHHKRWWINEKITYGSCGTSFDKNLILMFYQRRNYQEISHIIYKITQKLQRHWLTLFWKVMTEEASGYIICSRLLYTYIVVCGVTKEKVDFLYMKNVVRVIKAYNNFHWHGGALVRSNLFDKKK